MKTLLVLPLLLTAITATCLPQVSGNISYGVTDGRSRPEQNERSKRMLSPAEMPPGSNTMFLEASVLMNVKAEEYVALFAISQEADTVVDCNQKMDAVIAGFRKALKPMGINETNLFVDFVAQHKIYGYRLEANVAKEALVGFELKKNVSIHYRDKLPLDKLVVAVSQLKIFDLVKVDYIVRDPESVQRRLMEEATAVLKRKVVQYEKLLGIKMRAPPQVYAEKPSIYYPSELYESYRAYESEQVDQDFYRSKHTVQDLRKEKTFFFKPLTADGFDLVIDPVVLEPVVQFTLYLKVKYDLDLPK